MSVLTYTAGREPKAQAARVAARRGKAPPFSATARLEAGFLLRRLQRGDLLSMPHSRPMPSIGPRCHELRIVDSEATWRIVCRIDADAIVIAEVFAKKTPQTPKSVLETSRRRLKEYDRAGK